MRASLVQRLTQRLTGRQQMLLAKELVQFAGRIRSASGRPSATVSHAASSANKSGMRRYPPLFGARTPAAHAGNGNAETDGNAGDVRDDICPVGHPVI